MDNNPNRAANLRAVNEARRPIHVTRGGVVGKVCRLCLEWRPLTEFTKSSKIRDGLENRCKGCGRQRSLAYYHRNSAAVNEKRRTPEFREKMRPYHSRWEKHRRQTDLNYRLKRGLRLRIWRALKGLRKETPTMVLLGCSVEELKAHLESQFSEGMCWENYGQPGWEIDHIQPCASFDLSDPAQLAVCFHYTNLQPLWGPDNWRKGASTCG